MSAYHLGFVASVIHKNRPVRELNKNNRRTCILPFGDEYKLRLINQTYNRCQVEVFIDGTDVLFGNKLILNSNQTLDLERFVDNANSGSKFKFQSIKKAIEQKQLQNPNDPDNGHIEIRFYEETISYTLTTTWAPATTYFIYNPSAPVYDHGTLTCYNSTLGCSNPTTLTSGINCNAQEMKGVTIEGAKSNQGFLTTPDFMINPIPTTIHIWLEGKTDDLTTKQIFNTYIKPAIGTKNKSKLQVANEWIPKFLSSFN